MNNRHEATLRARKAASRTAHRPRITHALLYPTLASVQVVDLRAAYEQLPLRATVLMGTCLADHTDLFAEIRRTRRARRYVRLPRRFAAQIARRIEELVVRAIREQEAAQ